MSSPVPQEWTDMIRHLREAQVASDTMRSPTAQVDHDLATVAYSRAVDRMFAKLSLLSERQVLGRITMFLARRERS